MNGDTCCTNTGCVHTNVQSPNPNLTPAEMVAQASASFSAALPDKTTLEMVTKEYARPTKTRRPGSP
jgi:hypothetical protein